MIIFLEGLPGSGKSFNSLKDYIIPALLKGRKVFAYVEGLNHARIAEAAGMTEERVHQLLYQVKREDVPTIYDHVENDALVVLDELQNFWPAQRQPLNEPMRLFIAEHRHRGLDIVCMGQVKTDCHKMWLGRVDTLIVFMKRDAIGKHNEFKFTVYKRAGGKFAETTNGTGKYEEKYFGCYLSHTEDTQNKETFTEDRANIKNGKVFKWVRRYAVLLVIAVAYLIYCFAGGGLAKSMSGEKKTEREAPKHYKTLAEAQAAENASKTVPAQPVAAPASVPQGSYRETISGDAVAVQNDFIDALCQKYRIRLTGTIAAAGKSLGLIEWRDEAGAVKERLSMQAISGFGWLILVSTDGSVATLTKSDHRYIATAWPLQDFPGEFSKEQNKRIAQGDAPHRSEARSAAALAPAINS